MLFEHIETIFMKNQSLFWILGIVIAIFITWLFARAQKVKMRYCCFHNNIISNKNALTNGLTVKFKNKSVEDVSVTKYMLFNNGRVALKGSDVSKTDMFGIKLSKGEILTADIIDYNKNVSEPTLSQINKQMLKIDFHHINPKGAIIVQVVHTAPSSKDICVDLKGAGVDGAQKALTPTFSIKAKIMSGAMLFIYSVAFLLAFINREAYVKYLSACNTVDVASKELWLIGILILGLLIEFIYMLGGTWKWKYWGKFASNHNFFNR